LDIYEPIAIQLSALIDQLKVEKGWTSDSGALSDYESSVDGLRSGSNSLITLCGEETELCEELEDLGVQSDNGGVGAGENDEDTETTPTYSPIKTASNSSLKDELNEDGGIAAAPMISDAETSQSHVETPKTSQPHPLEDKEKDITDILSKIKSMSPEELPQCLEMTPREVQPSNEVISVSDLEKELFSDSSEDTSPEKQTAGQQEGNQKPRNAVEGVGRGGPRWPRDSDHNNRYPTYGYNKRGYKQRRGGFRAHRGRDHRSKENDNSTWLENRGHSAREHKTEGLQENGEKPPSDKKGRPEGDSPQSHTARKGFGQQEGVVSHQPSPLVHSRKMWSLPKRRGYRQHRDYEASDTFNHYEVGCFLLEGELATDSPWPRGQVESPTQSGGGELGDSDM
jgi:hypothetical protein